MIPLCAACLTQDEADDLRLGFFLLNPAFYTLTGHPWPRCARCARCTAEAMYKIPASWIPGPA